MVTGTVKVSMALLTATIIMIAGVALIFNNSAALTLTADKSMAKEGLDVRVFVKGGGLFAKTDADVNVTVTYQNLTYHSPIVYNTTIRAADGTGYILIRYDEFYVADGVYAISAKYKDSDPVTQSVAIKANKIGDMIVEANDIDNDNGSLSLIMMRYYTVPNTNIEPVDFLWKGGNGSIHIFYTSNATGAITKTYNKTFTYNGTTGTVRIANATTDYNMNAIKIYYEDFASKNDGYYMIRVDFTNNQRDSAAPYITNLTSTPIYGVTFPAGRDI